MENKFSRNFIGSTFCGPPRYQQHRNTSTMCLFGGNNTTTMDEMESLWKRPETTSPESILFDLIDTKKQPEAEPRDSRITIIKAACVPLINSVREFFRKNLPALTTTPTPKQDCSPDFSNSSVYMGLVTATLPPRKLDHKRIAGDLVDLSNYTVIHREEVQPEKTEKSDDLTDMSPPREAPATKATKSDLNCTEMCRPEASSAGVSKSERKMPTRRQREKKTCQNTQKSHRGKHMKEKMRKKFAWNIREDLNSEDDFEDEFEDVLSQEISSSIEDSASSQSPHTSDYVCDFIASIPSSEPRKISPCSFVKNLPAVLRMDIPFSPRRRQQAKKSPSECDSDDSFIVFCSESPKGTPDSTSVCERITKFRPCDRRRRLSEESDDSFVIFADDCKDDTNSEDEETASETSESDIESEPIQLDSGFEERKVRFNLKPEVHVIRAWEFAYRQARKGNWDQVARDRDRFEKRILSLGRVLSPILEQNHREKVYNERFRVEE
ncbi:uncharacterized protein LOC129789708 [Lutzomyia longipalpis]|uniref:uncharacterized protein LOC129789708 n=1 Tax=Lutzomyia longipalpis TaxID=7200 RepID=UPI002483BB88|nr:uncharacterized protein LOC129789708 [Lutzomyia longipalpis]